MFWTLINILWTVDVPTTANGRVYHSFKQDKLPSQKMYPEQFSLYAQSNLVHNVV